MQHNIVSQRNCETKLPEAAATAQHNMQHIHTYTNTACKGLRTQRVIYVYGQTQLRSWKKKKVNKASAVVSGWRIGVTERAEGRGGRSITCKIYNNGNLALCRNCTSTPSDDSIQSNVMDTQLDSHYLITFIIRSYWRSLSAGAHAHTHLYIYTLTPQSRQIKAQRRKLQTKTFSHNKNIFMNEI